MPEMDEAVIARFWALVDKRGPDECWPWLGAKSHNGYARFYIRSRQVPASRFSWSIANGKDWPLGLDACHTCDNRLCVNPAHIWSGSRKENMVDAAEKNRLGGLTGANARKTHCKYGHELTAANVRVRRRGGREHRRCRACDKVFADRYYAAKKRGER